MKNNLKTYSAYGIKIQSPVELPELLQSSEQPDAFIHLGDISDKLLEEAIGADGEFFNRPGVRIRASKKAMFFHWYKLGKILVREGREVIIELDPEAREEDLNPFLTGPILAVLLHQRGYFVLHASTVEIEGATVGFLGAKGYGKSTLAAYLRSRGHQLISDDIVPISFNKDEALTIPGFPRIKLYDDSITAVGASPENFPTIHRFVEKRSFQVAEDFPTTPIKLNALYVLDQGTKIEISKMNSIEAFIGITQNTHLNSYLGALQCQSKHFTDCQKLLKTVPVYKLKRPHDFTVINQLATKIEAHAHNLLFDDNNQ